ncbi:hypothetical protein FRB93_004173 [Tulasnella sp. JGI-2019a]|nr:hypothetical protein FRB93_004173 [Tulasnella sp. JGI-2019a]
MAYVSAGTKRKRDDDTHELDPERTTIHNQTTLSKLRAAQERLQVLQEEAAALKETEAALSKDIKEINDTLVAGAKAQLRGGPKATRWKWGRLVALTAQWCYGATVIPSGHAQTSKEASRLLPAFAWLGMSPGCSGKLSRKI